MLDINQIQISDEQKQRALKRAQRMHEKRRTQLQQVVQSHQLYLQNSAGDISVGTGKCELFGFVVLSIDATMYFTSGTLSFSGLDTSAAAIIAEGIGGATLYVPLDQIPSAGYVRVTADAEEVGGAWLSFYDKHDNALADLLVVLDGAGISLPDRVFGTFEVHTF